MQTIYHNLRCLSFLTNLIPKSCSDMTLVATWKPILWWCYLMLTSDWSAAYHVFLYFVRNFTYTNSVHNLSIHWHFKWVTCSQSLSQVLGSFRVFLWDSFKKTMHELNNCVTNFLHFYAVPIVTKKVWVALGMSNKELPPKQLYEIPLPVSKAKLSDMWLLVTVVRFQVVMKVSKRKWWWKRLSESSIAGDYVLGVYSDQGF